MLAALPARLFEECIKPWNPYRNVRRLVLELYGREFSKRVESSSFRNLESLELIHLLHYDHDELAGIWRVKPKDAGSNVERIFENGDSPTEVRVLERGEDGSSIVFIKRARAPRAAILRHDITMRGGGYLFGPMELRNGRLKISFVGSQAYLRKILREIESQRVKYRVILATDADFAADSLLRRLTDKQREALILAYELGYYDVPRTVGSEELANRLSLRRATVVEHLRKAEYRLLTGIIRER